MNISVLRESKKDDAGREVENRVILSPDQVKGLVKYAAVQVETKAGEKIGYTDADYQKAGARIASHQEALGADLILGVKETQLEDFSQLTPTTLFMSYQHFAQSRERTEKARKTGATFLCLETMETEKEGRKYFPCLAPMSEAAARILVRHADWWALRSANTISSGLSQTGMKSLRVTILGAGTVGRTAAREFGHRGYEVHLIDRPNLKKLPSSIKDSFFVVSSMYTAGRSPEKLITRELLKTMLSGGCAYPVDIDQGGGIEGAIETSILEPFDLPKIEGTEIYCFAPPNLPSLGARTTSEALGAAILPYVMEIAELGLEKAAEKDPTIRSGLNLQNCRIVHSGLASVFPGIV
jgi:alanine dehydrogenase